MIKKILPLVLMLSVWTAATMAQTAISDSKKYREAAGLAEDKAYDEAIVLFEELLVKNPNDLDLLYNLGYCHLNASSHAKAINYFNTLYGNLLEDEKSSALAKDVKLLIGKALQLSYKHADAIAHYEAFQKELTDTDTEIATEVVREIEICHNAIELMKTPVKLEVTNLGENINSKYDEHSPLISADESLLLFTSRRASSYSELLPDGQYAERIYSSVKENNTWDRSKSLKEIFKNPGHEAGVCLSHDGTDLYIFRNDAGGSDIYLSQFDGDNWSEPFRLPDPINSKFTETHASVSPDKNTLFFTSDRPGGEGGLDIYRVRKLPNGEWGKAQNLSVLNTPYDEETPIIHPNGRLLYFSSEGHNSMGKFDIFYSQLQADSTWSEPTNIGYPINTVEDDFFFVPTATQNLAYYASSNYEGSIGGSDIYLIEYEEPEINRLAVYKGQIATEGDTPMENVQVHVSNDNSNEEVGVFRPHPGTGKYVLILEEGEKYTITYKGEGFEEQSQSLDVKKGEAYKKTNATSTLSAINMVAAAKPEPTPATEDVVVAEVNDGIPYYTVQFLSLKKPVKSYDAFKGLDHSKIKVYECKDGWFKYAYGTAKGFKATLKIKEEVLKTGKWEDAFIRDVKQYESMVKTEQKSE